MDYILPLIKKTFAVALAAIQAMGGMIGIVDIPLENPIDAYNEAKSAIVTAQSDKSKDPKWLLDENEATYWSSAVPNGSYAEFSFNKPTTLNTVVIREKAERVRHFRLEAFIDGEWETFYKSDEIGTYRFCSFKSITTEKIRFVIDESAGRFKITEFEMYNIPPKKLDKDFKVTTYKQADSKNTYERTEKLAELKAAKGENSPEYKKLYNELKTYSRYFEVINEVILFNYVGWNENGDLVFYNGEEEFARELASLREILDMRDIKTDVRFTLTVLNPSDNKTARSSIDKHCGKLIDNIVNVCKKYDLRGVDFDWEYPQTPGEWLAYERLIQGLKLQLKFKVGADATVTVAMPTWGNKFDPVTKRAIDAVNIMAYDTYDKQGRHSTFATGAYNATKYFNEQRFTKEQMLLGVPYYGRPVNKDPYWPFWNEYELDDPYWTNMVPQQTYTCGGKEQTQDIYLNCPAMIADKVAYAVNAGIGGIMIFRLECDFTMDNPNSLTLAIENTLKERTVDYRK